VIVDKMEEAMGFFDDLIDAAIGAPGKILEKTVETVVRVPEAGVKVAKGAVDGKGGKNDRRFA
jgi:hypothetical protein